MNPRQALASALHLFVVFAFFVAGFFFVSLPYLPEIRIRVIDFFSNQFEKCTLVGLSLFVVALLFFVGFYALNRGRYLVIKMGVAADSYREGFKNWEMPRRCPDFESGEAGAEAAQPERLGDAGGSQKQRLSDAGRTNFRITSGINLIRQTLEEKLAQQFPKMISLQEVDLGPKSQIEINVTLAPTDEAAREELFIQVEREFSALLRYRFGYSKQFFLVVKD